MLFEVGTIYDTGTVKELLQNKFKGKCGREVEVMLKLHLILPNAEKKNPSSREVTTDNYQECFSLIKESALFEFEALNIGHDIEESMQQNLGKFSVTLFFFFFIVYLYNCVLLRYFLLFYVKCIFWLL